MSSRARKETGMCDLVHEYVSPRGRALRVVARTSAVELVCYVETENDNGCIEDVDGMKHHECAVYTPSKRRREAECIGASAVGNSDQHANLRSGLAPLFAARPPV